MDGYHIALFIHFVAIFGAVAAAALVHISAHRRARAATVREMSDWHGVLSSSAKGFPVALATLVLSGSYMVGAGPVRTWSTGFVVAGLVGVVLLLASGIFMSTKGRALKARLDEMEPGAPAPRLVPTMFMSAMEFLPIGIMLGVVFDMTTKPATVGAALAIVVLGAVLGGMVGVARRPKAAVEAVEA